MVPTKSRLLNEENSKSVQTQSISEKEPVFTESPSTVTSKQMPKNSESKPPFIDSRLHNESLISSRIEVRPSQRLLNKSDENISKLKLAQERPQAEHCNKLPVHVSKDNLSNSTSHIENQSVSTQITWGESGDILYRILATLQKRIRATDEGISISNINCRTARSEGCL